jgi:5-methylcytosine-specific restriction endonuclease McrA
MSSFYSFSGLQKTVEEAFGIVIDPEGGDFKVEQKITRLESHEIDKVIFKDGDIYLKDGDEEFKGFIVKEENYRKAYPDREIGRPSHLPKFHTTECDTLVEMKQKKRFDGVYIFANTPLERKEAAEGGGMMSDLRVCKNCLKVDEKLSGIIYTKEFVEEHLNSGEGGRGFRETDLPKQYEKDEWGYVHGWDEISLRYRAKMGYICEVCGINLSKNRYYLEVHHLNSNKTDNRESNLQCLCTECHSNVDQFHRDNFYGQEKNSKKLMDFKRLFRKKTG